MSCVASFGDYALRSIGLGERLLPRSDITLCDQIVLIGSGMLWNVYFSVVAILFGFGIATVLALARDSSRSWLALPAAGFIYLFRGTPLFIQFFFAYELFVLLPKVGITIPLGFMTLDAGTYWLTRAWCGALIVLVLNTSAYTAQIFWGALAAIPRGDIEAAAAIGLTGWRRFRRIIWPTMLRLAWPSYTNEAIFLYHATTLVFFSGFPAWRQQGDALYYASYFADKTFNPFISYPIAAAFFVLGTLGIILIFGRIGVRLNRHLPAPPRKRFVFRPQYIR